MPIIRDTRTIVSGVASVAKSGGAAITGAVTLSEGAGISLTEAGNDIAIATTGPLIASVTLNDAQLKALNAGVEIVPAPGNGKSLCLLAGYVFKNFTGGVYTNIGAGQSYFVYDTAFIFDVASSILASSVLMGNANIARQDYGLPSPVNLHPGDFRNTNIGFSADNNLGAYTGGDAANTATLTVVYAVMTGL